MMYITIYFYSNNNFKIFLVFCLTCIVTICLKIKIHLTFIIYIILYYNETKYYIINKNKKNIFNCTQGYKFII